MPLKPNAGEGQDAFISRCMGDGHMQSSFPDKKQRLAVCYSEFRKKTMKDGEELPDFLKDEEKFKLETVTLDNVEIIDQGEWKGIKFDDSRYGRIIDNFKKGIIEPYITIDHDTGTTAAMKKILKAVSLGFVSDLRKVGTKLVATFKQVPKKVAELIEAGALKKRSVEYWKRYTHADGKVYDDVLEAVTFHGANGAPAIHTLSDVVALYKDELQTIEHGKHAGSCETIEFDDGEKGKENNMDEIEKLKAEIEKMRGELSKFKNDSSVDDLVKLKAEKEKVDKDLADSAKKIADLEKFKADQVEKEKVALKDEAETFVKKVIEEKKLLPKFKDMKVAEYIKYKGDVSEDGKKAFTLFKEELESRDKILNFGDLDTGSGGTAGGKVDMKNVDTTADNIDNFDKIEEAIQTQMKRDGSSYEEAAVKLGLMTTEEAGLKKEGK